MNLVFYSGGYRKENRVLASEAAALLGLSPKARIAFVPSSSDDAKADFRDFKRSWAPSGRFEFLMIPVDRALSKADEARLLTSDAIFLGGGNTFYFLHHLRERRLLSKLRAFVAKGGLLMGLSAGSILMTPNVRTASVPSLDCDENEIGLRNFRALDLVPFEFSPHYYPSRKVDEELLLHSTVSRYPIYACADGEGIVVRNGKIRFIGSVTIFHRGFKYTLQ